MYEKHLRKSDILSIDASVFKHFVSKNQLPGFYISARLVENGLSRSILVRHHIDGVQR